MGRAWVKTENVKKMGSELEPPVKMAIKPQMKVRIEHALQMATNARKLSREERLEKYSFVALFKGKWGTNKYSDSSTDEEQDSPSERRVIKKKKKPQKEKSKE